MKISEIMNKIAEKQDSFIQRWKNDKYKWGRDTDFLLCLYLSESIAWKLKKFSGQKYWIEILLASLLAIIVTLIKITVVIGCKEL